MVSSLTDAQSNLIQTTTVETSTLEWKKVGGEWKLYRFTPTSRTTQHKNLTPPKWATSFTKAVGLIGKGKADIVATFGPPTNASYETYRYLIDTQTHRGIIPGTNNTTSILQRTFLDLQLDDGKVIDVILTLDHSEGGDHPEIQIFPTADEVWNALEMQDTKPDTLQMKDEEALHHFLQIKEYSHDFSETGITGSDFSVRMHAFLKGNIPLLMDCGSHQPPFQGAPMFDVNTNRYVIRDLFPNSMFSWRAAKVFTIQTDNRASYAKKPLGKDRPVK